MLDEQRPRGSPEAALKSPNVLRDALHVKLSTLNRSMAGGNNALQCIADISCTYGCGLVNAHDALVACGFSGHAL